MLSADTMLTVVQLYNKHEIAIFSYIRIITLSYLAFNIHKIKYYFHE